MARFVMIFVPKEPMSLHSAFIPQLPEDFLIFA